MDTIFHSQLQRCKCNKNRNRSANHFYALYARANIVIAQFIMNRTYAWGIIRIANNATLSSAHATLRILVAHLTWKSNLKGFVWDLYETVSRCGLRHPFHAQTITRSGFMRHAGPSRASRSRSTHTRRACHCRAHGALRATKRKPVYDALSVRILFATSITTPTNNSLTGWLSSL